MTPAKVPDGLIRASLASYARYWREAFRLPSMDHRGAGAVSSIEPCQSAASTSRPALDAGRGAIIALPHSGNWDMAGVWLVAQARHASPPSPSGSSRNRCTSRFIDYRESLGFEMLPLTGGERPPFEVLAERLRANGMVCLMADRDLTRSRRAGRLLRRAHAHARRPGEAGDRDGCRAAADALLVHARQLGDRCVSRPLDTSSGDVAVDHAGAGRPVRHATSPPIPRTGT